MPRDRVNSIWRMQNRIQAIPGELAEIQMPAGANIAVIGGSRMARETLRCVLSETDLHVIDFDFSTAVAEMLYPDVDIALVAGERSGKIMTRVRSLFPEARIVLINEYLDLQEMAVAFGEGISGYLLRETPSDRLVGLLRLVTMGEKVFPSQLGKELLRHIAVDYQDHSPATIEAARLSRREIEILLFIAKGLSNKAISQEISISAATVKVHVKTILRKLAVANRTQAALWASSRGMSGPGRN